jgi:flavin reductase (DIM6/NTAB) family NADH-FMN oxidoreductase RutF/DNA-binding IclR family transcriptional regulator
MNLDPRELRQVLGAFPTGVTVVTTLDGGGRPFGVTANSFSSVSLDPPLILWSQSNTSSSHPAFRDSDHFVVNVMAQDQVDVATRFAKSGIDKFQGVSVRPGIGGTPVIEGAAATLECTKVAAYPGGDHTIFVGRIERMERSPRPSLAFGNGRYMVTFAHDLGGALPASEGAGQLLAIEAVRLASTAMVEIVGEIGDRTLGLAVWGSAGPTIVRWEPSRQPVSVHLQTGVVVSLTQSATGRAFATFMDEATTAPLVAAELQGRSATGHPDTGEFAQRLAEAREHGLSRSIGKAPSQRHGVTVNAFSAPVFDASGRMVLALSTTCEAERLPPDWDGAVPVALARAARRLSERLGHGRARDGGSPA